MEAERDVLGDVLSCIVALVYSLLMAGVLTIFLNSCGSVPKWGEVARGHVVCGEARLRYIVSSWKRAILGETDVAWTCLWMTCFLANLGVDD